MFFPIRQHNPISIDHCEDALNKGEFQHEIGLECLKKSDSVSLFKEREHKSNEINYLTVPHRL